MEYSYRFRIYPTEKQKELITKTFGCCRYVFNYFLDRRKAVYKATGKGLPLKDCTRELTALKKGLPWLQEVDATSLQAAVQNLDRAYVNFGFIEKLVVFYLENSGHKITLYTKRWFALANHFFLCYNIFRYFSIFGGFLLTLNQYLL